VLTRAQLRAEKLAKALKACRKKPKGERRGRCEKQARQKYGKANAGKAANDNRRAGR
jgi:hypothetical protein